ADVLDRDHLERRVRADADRELALRQRGVERVRGPVLDEEHGTKDRVGGKAESANRLLDAGLVFEMGDGGAPMRGADRGGDEVADARLAGQLGQSLPLPLFRLDARLPGALNR